jgi:hypothetical protein
MFQRNIIEKIETHILCSIAFFPPESHADFKTMWKNIVELGRRQRTTWCVRIACWITKTTHTHTHTHHTHTHTHTLRICNTCCFSTTTMVARTRLIVRLYYIACHVVTVMNPLYPVAGSSFFLLWTLRFRISVWKKLSLSHVSQEF